MSWEGVGVIVAILMALFTMISGVWSISFFFGKFFTKFDGLVQIFEGFEKSFEKHMTEEKNQADAMWKKLDGHGEKLVEHHQRLGTIEKQLDKKEK